MASAGGFFYQTRPLRERLVWTYNLVMAYPLPEGEDLRRAIRWISAARQETDRPLYRLVEEAVFKFDLSPKDGEFLTNFFREDSAE